MKPRADDTATEPILILEVLAEGGSITLKGLHRDGEWRYVVFVNECALDDEGGELSEIPYGTWDEAARRLERYPWPRMHIEYVHPDFASRTKELAERHPRKRES
jgi:hypothetical protein